MPTKKRFRPKVRQKYFFIAFGPAMRFAVTFEKWEGSRYDEANWEDHNAFETYEDCKNALKRVLAALKA